MAVVEVDARGQQCPIPVVRAKKALREVAEGDTVRVLVDNEVAVNNLTNLANTMKCGVSSETLGEANYAVNIERVAEANVEADFDVASCTPAAANRVVLIGSKYVGVGNDELGAILMKGFIFALTQQDVLPNSVLFYNEGAYLTCEGSESLDDIRALEAAGVEILTCGTCLNHLGIADNLAVGGVTNLYVLAEKQLTASVVVKP